MKLACINSIRVSISLSLFVVGFFSLALLYSLIDYKRFYSSYNYSSTCLKTGFLTVFISGLLYLPGVSSSYIFSYGLLQYFDSIWVEVSISAGIWFFISMGRGESSYLWAKFPFINSVAPNNNSYFWVFLYFSNWSLTRLHYSSRFLTVSSS